MTTSAKPLRRRRKKPLPKHRPTATQAATRSRSLLSRSRVSRAVEAARRVGGGLKSLLLRSFPSGLFKLGYERIVETVVRSEPCMGHVLTLRMGGRETTLVVSLSLFMSTNNFFSMPLRSHCCAHWFCCVSSSIQMLRASIARLMPRRIARASKTSVCCTCGAGDDQDDDAEPR